MNHLDFETILDECIARLRQGDSIEDCLLDFPNHALELAPLLTLSAQMNQLSVLQASSTAFAAGKAQMLMAATAVAASSVPPKSPSFWHTLKAKLTSPTNKETIDMRLIFRGVVLALLLLVIGSGLAISASAQSLPGEVLYPVKRSWENTRLFLMLDKADKDAFETQLQKERFREVEVLLTIGKQQNVSFYGILDDLNEDNWTINGLTVLVDEETEISGQPEVGRPLMIQAIILPNGQLLAIQIQVKGEIDPPDNRPDRPLPTTAPTKTPLPTRPNCQKHECPTATLLPPPATATCAPYDCNQETVTPPSLPPTATPSDCENGICPSPTYTPEPTTPPCNTPNCETPTAPAPTAVPPTTTCDPVNCAPPTEPPCNTPNCETPTAPAPTAVPPTATCDPVNCAPPTEPPCNTPNCETPTVPPPTAVPPTATCDPVNCAPPTEPPCNTPNCVTPTAPAPTAVPPTATCAPVNCVPPTEPPCNTPNCETPTAPPPTAVPPTATCDPVNCVPPTEPPCNTPNCVTPTPES